jgi:hypothetical protein
VKHKLLKDLEEGFKALLTTAPTRREILLTWKEIQIAFNYTLGQMLWFRYGAKDFPRPPTFRAAIENWHRRKRRVTARQREALNLKSQGLSYRDMGRKLGITHKCAWTLCKKGLRNSELR